MQDKVTIIPISAEIYPAFYQMVQNTQWGNPMLPQEYSSSLWGDIMLLDKNIIGGFIGNIKGNQPLVSHITKCVYFDSYPMFINSDYEAKYRKILLDTTKEHAAKDNVIMLHLTHWIRGSKMPLDRQNKEATFVVNLSNDESTLFKNLDSPKQRNVKKASKFDLEILACRGNEAIQYLPDFQRLRECTQKRAITKHSQASMLLKSNDFFTRLMLQPNATLLLGKYENKVISVALMLQGGNTIYYHSGGSDIEANRKTCCSPYLFWKAFLYFKNEGIKYFDMGGVPTIADETNPAYGVYRFKKSFGGEYTEFDGGDIIISRWKYKFLNWILSQRKILRFFSTKI